MTARIVVDAMGGDNAPGEIVAGALMAAGGLGVAREAEQQRRGAEQRGDGDPRARGTGCLACCDHAH